MARIPRFGFLMFVWRLTMRADPSVPGRPFTRVRALILVLPHGREQETVKPMCG